MTAQRPTKARTPVAGGYENIRGRFGYAEVDGKFYYIEVVTHTRGNRWVVEGRLLPQRFERYRGCRRTTVHRNQLKLNKLASAVSDPQQKAK